MNDFLKPIFHLKDKELFITQDVLDHVSRSNLDQKCPCIAYT